MIEGPELEGLEALAAEHALGVLSGQERAVAEARMARDPAFAAQVEAWRARLALLLDGMAGTPPPTGLWTRIERLLPANDDGGAAVRRLRFWRGTAIGALALAAASLTGVAVLVNRPPVVVQAPAKGMDPLLNANLMPMPRDGGAQPLFVVAYDPERKAMIITSLMRETDPRHVHQLWVIPQDGRPRSLGMIEPGESKAMPMPRSMDPMMAEGSALVVSLEPQGGSTNPQGPSGPIAAMGRLAKV